jgi:hypothetical protein
MKRALVLLTTVCFSATAFAQSPPPKASKKPAHAQAAPKSPMGCKLVGTVRGTKLWAGDCVASDLRGAAPTETQTLPEQAPGAAPGEKQ